MISDSNFSLMKCSSTSTCLFLSCWTKIYVTYVNGYLVPEWVQCFHFNYHLGFAKASCTFFGMTIVDKWNTKYTYDSDNLWVDTCLLIRYFALTLGFGWRSVFWWNELTSLSFFFYGMNGRDATWWSSTGGRQNFRLAQMDFRFLFCGTIWLLILGGTHLFQCLNPIQLRLASSCMTPLESRWRMGLSCITSLDSSLGLL